ncbi:MAG TPA: hypothetical protein VGE69_00990 [Pseudomonadales bacterium]
MAARQSLSFVDGALGGVNTMLNVINAKENMADRKYTRERRLVLDQQQDEDRTRNMARQDKQDAQSETLFGQQQRINEFSLSNLQGQDRQRRITESYNLLRAFNSFSEGTEMDPAAVRNSLNYFLTPLLNQGEPVNSRKQIADIYPDEQGRGVYVELDVTPESGEAYRAPLTQGRSSRGDDPVALVPYEDLFNLVYEVTDDLQDAGFKGTPREVTKQLEEFFRVASGDRSVENAAAADAQELKKHRLSLELDDHKTENEIRRDEARERARAATGGGSNSTIQTIEYLRANLRDADGKPISVEQALDIANVSKSNPRDAVLRVYETLAEAQAARAFTPGAAGTQLTDEQLLQQAQQMVADLDAQIMPTARSRLALPQAPAEAGADMFEEMPDPKQYPGAEIEDEESGVRYRSNGQVWEEVR